MIDPLIQKPGMQALLDRGANPNILDRWQNSPVQDALKSAFGAIAAALIERVASTKHAGAFTMLQTAATTHPTQLKQLILGGVSADVTEYDQRTVLHIVCAEGNLNAVQSLIAAGASIHAQDRCLLCPACRRISVLIRASCYCILVFLELCSPIVV